MPRLVVALAVVCAATLAAQSPPWDVTVEGTVASTEGFPLRRARVFVAGDPLDALTVTPTFTDADGRFAITVPARASYSLTVSKAGYETVRATVVAADVHRPVRLRRAAVIAGRVFDEAGTPIEGVAAVEGLAITSRRDAASTDPSLLDALSLQAERISLEEREVHRRDFAVIRR